MTAIVVTNIGGAAVALFGMAVLLAALPIIGWVERHDPMRPSRLRRWLARHAHDDTGGVW